VKNTYKSNIKTSKESAFNSEISHGAFRSQDLKYSVNFNASVIGPWYRDHGSRMRRAGVGSKPLHIFCATSALVSNLHFKKLSPGSQGDSGEPGRQSADKVKVSQQSPPVQKHQEKASNVSSTSCNSPVLLYHLPLLSGKSITFIIYTCAETKKQVDEKKWKESS